MLQQRSDLAVFPERPAEVLQHIPKSAMFACSSAQQKIKCKPKGAYILNADGELVVWAH